MAKLTSRMLESVKKQLGGDREIIESSGTHADAKPVVADARVPRFDTFREATAESTPAVKSDSTNEKSAKKGKHRMAKGGNPGKSDYSVRSRAKNTDAGSKVDIISSKSDKIVYRQG